MLVKSRGSLRNLSHLSLRSDGKASSQPTISLQKCWRKNFAESHQTRRIENLHGVGKNRMLVDTFWWFAIECDQKLVSRNVLTMSMSRNLIFGTKSCGGTWWWLAHHFLAQSLPSEALQPIKTGAESHRLDDCCLSKCLRHNSPAG